MSRQIDFDNLTKGDVAFLEMNGRGREVEDVKARKAAEAAAEQEANEVPGDASTPDPSGLDAASEAKDDGAKRPEPPKA